MAVGMGNAVGMLIGVIVDRFSILAHGNPSFWNTWLL
jgi:hypothetical protein